MVNDFTFLQFWLFLALLHFGVGALPHQLGQALPFGPDPQLGQEQLLVQAQEQRLGEEQAQDQLQDHEEPSSD